MKIWGAGISGLIAANVFQTAEVIEASAKADMVGHKALLRFRSTAVADAVGIDFRKVRVNKGLWADGRFVQPNIMHANHYSMKVLRGGLADRSVWSLDPVDRYIAPENFVDQLIERCGDRIAWGTKAELAEGQEPTISTIPMGVLAKMLGASLEPTSASAMVFPRAAIEVKRWRIPRCDVHQTVYVSDPSTRCYRVSITGDLLIAEYMLAKEGNMPWPVYDDFDVFEPFGLRSSQALIVDKAVQSHGKIEPIDDAWRRRFILDASNKHNIFSLGRFGTWRNILLDDVVHDISVIKRLISDDTYGRSRHSAK